MPRQICCCFLSLVLLGTSTFGAQRPNQRIGELVQQLHSDDAPTRARAEARLIELGTEAAEALVDVICRKQPSSRRVANATVRILAHWERKSWTDTGCEAAIDKFVKLVRDRDSCPSEHLPLTANERFPFSEAVRVLDIAPNEAAEYLRAKGGIKLGQSKAVGNSAIRYYSSVRLTAEWVREPKDWLYIANLAREIPGTPFVNGRRHPISITIDGPIDGDTLVECLRFFRKSKRSSFSLQLDAPITREALLLLQSYPLLLGLSGRKWDADITDEDWAKCISAWPDMINLILSPSAGPKAIAAASKLKHVVSLQFNTATLTDDNLEPLRNHETVEVLLILNVETFELTSYRSHDGMGKWQIEE